MARVHHDELTTHGELAVALRWLRHRRRLTQGQLREAVEAGGGSISLIYIQQLEAGRKRPSPRMLDALLEALGSDRADLAVLLEEVQGAPATERDRGWRPSRRDPAGASDSPGGAWSDEVELTGASASSVARGVISPEPDPFMEELGVIVSGLAPHARLELLQAARLLAARRS